MYLGLSPKPPVEVTSEMVDFYNQQQGISIPGTSLRADIQPAQQSLMNTLYLVGAVAVLVYLMRSK
jgi:hypothetical protein